jgi:hypothetical protein
MSTTYKPLPQEDSENDVVYPPSRAEELRSNRAPSAPRFPHVAAYLLLFLNLVLAAGNAWASYSIDKSLATILPAQNLLALPRPDQYYGLPETSRYKSAPQVLLISDSLRLWPAYDGFSSRPCGSIKTYPSLNMKWEHNIRTALRVFDVWRSCPSP